jgi:hypothetical protein
MAERTLTERAVIDAAITWAAARDALDNARPRVRGYPENKAFTEAHLALLLAVRNLVAETEPHG